MKRYIYILLALLIFAGCAEDSIVPDVDFENLYAITDDPNDPVRHKTYEIFKKYNVPVFFNDTIGMAKSGVDFSGKPVYKYETIDLSWNFSSYDKAKYSFVFVSDEEQKMKSLNVIESYLEIVNSALRPFCFLVVESAKRVDNSTGAITEVSDGTFRIYFRTVLLTGDFEGETYLGIPEALKRELILSKINNLAEDLAYFNPNDAFDMSLRNSHQEDSSVASNISAAAVELATGGTQIAPSSGGGGGNDDEWWERERQRSKQEEVQAQPRRKGRH